MPRPHYDAAVIGALRAKVIEHNETVGRENPHATKLEALKKIYGRAWRGPGSEENAMAAVEKHLALAKAEFDETKHRRDENGRFSSKGTPVPIGQRRQYADVRTESQDRRLRDNNSGYQAAQTAVIPETRYSTLLPYALGTLAALNQIRSGATADFGKDPFNEALRRGARGFARLTGYTAGRSAGDLLGAGQMLTANVARRMGVKAKPVDVQNTARRSDAMGRALAYGAGKGMDAYTWVQLRLPDVISERMINASLTRAPQQPGIRGFAGRVAHQAVGRLGGATVGLLSGLPVMIPGAAYIGSKVGEVLDSAYPRRVDKLDAPEIDDLLAKVQAGAGVDDLMKASPAAAASAAKRVASTAVDAVVQRLAPGIQQRAAAAAAGNATLSRAKGVLLGRPYSGLPYTRPIQVAGALGAGALGAAAGYGATRLAQAVGDRAGGQRGNPYRDEDGRFTSRDKAAFVVGGLGALAAAGAAAYGMRRGNARAWGSIVGRLRGMSGDMASRAADAIAKETNELTALYAKKTAVADRAVQSYARLAADPFAFAVTNLDEAARSAARNAFRSSSTLTAFENTASQGQKTVMSQIRSGAYVDPKVITKTFQQKDVAKELARINADISTKRAKGLEDIERRLGLATKRGADDLATLADNYRAETANLANAKRPFLGSQGQPPATAALEGILEDARAEKWSSQKIEQAFAPWRGLSRHGVVVPKTKTATLEDVETTLKSVQARVKEITDLEAQADKAFEEAKKALDLRSAIDRGGEAARSAIDKIGSIKNPFDAAKTIPLQPPSGAIRAVERVEGNRKVIDYTGTEVDKIRARLGLPDLKRGLEATRKLAADAARGKIDQEIAALVAAGPGIIPATLRPAYRSAEKFLGASTAGARADIARAIRAARTDFSDVDEVSTYIFGGKKGDKDIPNILSRAQQVGQWASDHMRGLLAATGGTGLAVFGATNDAILDNLGVRDVVENLTGAKVKTFSRIEDDGRGNKRMLWGVYDTKSGEVLYGDATDLDSNTSRAIQPGEKLKNVEERVFRRGGGGGGGNQNQGGGASISWGKDASDLQQAIKATKDGNLGTPGARQDDGTAAGTVYFLDPEKNWKGDNRVRTAHDKAVGKVNGFLNEGSRSVAQKLQAVTGADITRVHEAGEIARYVGRIVGGEIEAAIRDNNMSRAAALFDDWSRNNPQAGGPALARAYISIAKAGRMSHGDYIPAAKRIGGIAPAPGGGGGGGGSGGGGGWAVPLRGVTKAQASATPPPAPPAPRPPRNETPPWDADPVAKSISNRLWATHGSKIMEAGTVAREFGNETQAGIRSAFEFAVDTLYQNALLNSNSPEEARRRVERMINDNPGAIFGKMDTPAGLAVLAKSLASYEETKHKRQPKGSDKGGEFAPKGGAGAAVAPTSLSSARQQDRSFFEPVRFAGTAGGYAGMQVAFDIASKYLPGAKTRLGGAGNLAVKLGTGLAGSAAGTHVGERLGSFAYTARGKKAPGSYEPPERSLGEDLSRVAGGLIGSFAASAIPGGYAVKLATSALAGMSGEELGGAIYRGISGAYGDDVARSVQRALR